MNNMEQNKVVKEESVKKTTVPVPNKEVPHPKKEVAKKTPMEEVKKKETEIPESIVEETGINLIPTMTKEEIKVDEKKKKINVSALVSLSLLFSVSILITGFNIISKIQLNTEKDKLFAYEKSIEAYNQFILGNNEILERVSLYKDIQEGKFSTKAVVDYVESIATKSGSSELIEFSFSGGRGFSFTGEAQDLEDVAKLWYLLTNDLRIEGITLKSISKGEDGTRFSFTGDLKLDQFVNSTNN